LAIRKRVVDDRRKKINRLYKRAVPAGPPKPWRRRVQAVDTGVIERIRTHEDVAV
jgi:hypothetical protein